MVASESITQTASPAGIRSRRSCRFTSTLSGYRDETSEPRIKDSHRHGEWINSPRSRIQRLDQRSYRGPITARLPNEDIEDHINTDHSPTKQETERWFVRRGVPHFITAYNASEDVLTRAVPALTLVFLFSAISAVDLDWPTWGIVLASAGGLLVLVTAWMVLNRIRGRKLLATPERIGRVEIGLFLGVPTLLPLLFGGDITGSAITFVSLVVILLIIYVATSYGLVSLSVWAIKQMGLTLGQTVRLFARSLPLLLLGFMFIFINAEAWQSAGQLDLSLLVAVAALFAFLAAVFLISQIPREMDSLNTFESWNEVVRWSDDAPVDTSRFDRHAEPDPPPLALRERGNLFLVFFISQGFRLALVSSLVGLFFVVLGLLIIRPETITLWIEERPDAVWEFAVAGIDMTLTRELIQVSTFLAAFAAVYFSVYTITDRTLRSEFFEDTIAEARQNVAVRAIYRQ